MARKITIVAVDMKFFDNVFERERRKMQKKIGVDNLSQANFTKMIEGFKIREPNMDLSQVNTKVKRKRNGKI